VNERYTLIVGAAPAPGRESSYGRIIRAAPHVIAADGGLAVCMAADRLPDLLVGDFDSVDREALESVARLGVPLKRHPMDKDASDLDLALVHAREAGARSVRFAAAFSGRLDHTLAALGTLLRAADLSGSIDEPDLQGYALDSRYKASLSLQAPAGQSLSIFSVNPSTTVSLAGVRYPLTVGSLPVLSSLGLSNVALGGEFSVTVHSGSVVVLVSV